MFHMMIIMISDTRISFSFISPCKTYTEMGIPVSSKKNLI